MRASELFEEIPLSQARYYMQLDHQYKEMYGDVFGSKHRIFIPCDKPTASYSMIEYKVGKFLNSIGYKISDYAKGYAKKPDSKNEIKIGKLLAKQNAELLKQFENDPARQASQVGDTLVVISRHPYDLAGMSTQRGWKSCMALPHYNRSMKQDIDRGQYADCIDADVQHGSLIAYQVSRNDINVKKPIARIVIKPGFSESGDVALTLKYSTVYGDATSNFMDVVQSWVADYNASHAEEGEKYEMPAGLYNDLEGGTMDAGEHSFEYAASSNNRALVDQAKTVVKFQNKMDLDVAQMAIEVYVQARQLNLVKYLVDQEKINLPPVASEGAIFLVRNGVQVPPKLFAELLSKAVPYGFFSSRNTIDDIPAQYVQILIDVYLANCERLDRYSFYNDLPQTFIKYIKPDQVDTFIKHSPDAWDLFPPTPSRIAIGTSRTTEAIYAVNKLNPQQMIEFLLMRPDQLNDFVRSVRPIPEEVYRWSQKQSNPRVAELIGQAYKSQNSNAD